MCRWISEREDLFTPSRDEEQKEAVRGKQGGNFGIPGVLKAFTLLCLLAVPGRAQAPPGTPQRPKASVAAKGHTRESAAFEDIAKRATAAREADRTEEALRLYKEALGLKPSWAEGWWYLGTLYYDTDRYAEALPAFRSLVGLQRQMGPAWALLGLCEFEVHDYENSLIHLERSRGLGLAGNEELINVTRYHAALLYIQLHNFDTATQLLSSLVKRGVNSEQVQVAMGLALLRVPLLPNQVDPSKDALVHAAGEAAVLVGRDDTDQAEAKYERLLKDYPQTPFLHYAYGVMLSGISHLSEAEEQFRQEMQVTPESALPYMHLAYIKLRLRQSEEALSLAEQAVQRAPKSFAAHYLLGRTLLELGRVQPSIGELEAARKLGPLSPEVRYNLARAYTRAHRTQDAERERAEFTRLNALLQKEAEQRTGRGQAYRTSGDQGEIEPHEVQVPSEPPPK